MINKIIKFFVILSISILFCFKIFAADFSDEIEDLPLAEGYEIIDQDTIYFDKPEGRILIFTAFSKDKNSNPLVFYAQTLPQLGWIQLTPHEFAREGESLKIEDSNHDNGRVLKFILMPKK